MTVDEVLMVTITTFWTFISKVLQVAWFLPQNSCSMPFKEELNMFIYGECDGHCLV
jgi:hypothetical protein